ncbi:hypothetical protein Hanom_Chr07g00627431 [Helianthus anomalus]
MLGILPKGYTLSSLEASQREGSLNVQAGTVFVNFEFTEQVSKLSCFTLLTALPKFKLCNLSSRPSNCQYFVCADKRRKSDSNSMFNI